MANIDDIRNKAWFVGQAQMFPHSYETAPSSIAVATGKAFPRSLPWGFRRMTVVILQALAANRSYVNNRSNFVTLFLGPKA